MEEQFIKFVCEGNDENTGKVGQGLLESGNFEGFDEILSHIPKKILRRLYEPNGVSAPTKD